LEQQVLETESTPLLLVIAVGADASTLVLINAIHAGRMLLQSGRHG